MNQVSLAVQFFHVGNLIGNGSSTCKRTHAMNQDRPILDRIIVIDSHTAGEPTRVVVDGGPPLGTGSVAVRCRRFQTEFDRFRSAVVNEPHGSDVMVGALVVPPEDPTCTAGVIFFNNVGFLGMCGHGTIGLVATLAHLGRIGPGDHRIETPVGVVGARLAEDKTVSIQNVPSYRTHKDVTVLVPNVGPVTGDIAWGGNWFFLVQDQTVDLARDTAEDLTAHAWRIRQALNAQGFPEVDHIELFGPPARSDAHARNFVLCPGKAYDRSPCGTGTSAKLACLAEDGKLAEDQVWIQESFIGTTFEASYQWIDEHKILPTIRGAAFINAESSLLLDGDDPFCWGIGA
jgi:4-hydroxyproline epimerase